MPTSIAAGVTLLTSQQAAEAAGISHRQLDHWVRIGQVIKPSATPWEGSGIHRRWTPDEVRVLAVLGHLAAAHAPMTVMASAANVLLDVDPPKKGDGRWLVVDHDWAQVVAGRELTKIAAKGGLWFVSLAIGGTIAV